MSTSLYLGARRVIRAWVNDGAERMGAALAFYTIFSLAPLLVIIVSIVQALVSGPADEQVVREFSNLIGGQGDELFLAMVRGAQRVSGGVLVTALGIAALFLGAGGMFRHLSVSLSAIFDFEKPKRRWLGFLHKNLVSLLMVVASGFLLLVSLVLGAVLSEVLEVIAIPFLSTFVNLLSSLCISWLAVLLLFRYAPSGRLPWKSLAIGALVTAVLFTIGKALIGLFLDQAGLTTTYGAATSVVAILLWAYYSAQLLLLGAEIANVHARAE